MSKSPVYSRFDFVYKTEIYSEFGPSTYDSTKQNCSHFVAPHCYDGEKLFWQLQEQVFEIDVMQMLTLMSWDSSQWDTDVGKQLMYRWWDFAIHKTLTGNNQFQVIMVLRSILADKERYPGPEPVIRNMRLALTHFLKKNAWPQPEQKNILLAIIQNQPDALAQLAFQNRKLPLTLLKNQSFPTNLPIVAESGEYWLIAWLNSHDALQQENTSLLKQLLNNISLETQLKYTRALLKSPIFQIYNSRASLERYHELISYLSKWARQSEFREGLSYDEIRRLNDWLGTGNYQSLKRMLFEIVKKEAEQTNDPNLLSTSTNRYAFWTDYQHLFREAWLLLPASPNKTTYFEHTSQNIKLVIGLLYPTILIRLGNYFVLQTFAQRGIQSELTMTKDIEAVEALLSKPNCHNIDVARLSLCLIHDHLFSWQIELARTLAHYFDIHSKNGKVHITPEFNISYKSYRYSEENREKRLKPLELWCITFKNRYGQLIFEKIALSIYRQDALR